MTVKQPVVNEKKSQYWFKSNSLFIAFITIYIYIEKTTALYQASDFTGFSDSYAAPAGSSDVIFTGSVDLILPTGITQQVSGTLSTALKCTHSMEQQQLYSLSPSEDGTIINLRPKLLILGNTYINQKMMTSYVFTYHGNQVQGIHVYG